MQHVLGVIGPGMPGRGRVGVDDLQPGPTEHLPQLLAAAQAQVLGEVGEHQPALAARPQVLAEPLEEAAEHARALVVDRQLESGRRLARQPGRIADDQIRPARREEVRLQHRDAVLQAQALHVLLRALHRAGVDVRGDHAGRTALGEDRGQNAGARAEIHGVRSPRHLGHRGPGHQVDVLGPRGREHAVARVDARAERRDGHSLLVPLVGAEHTLQLGERDQGALLQLPVRLPAGVGDVRSAPQGEPCAGFEEHDDPAEHFGPFGALGAMRAEQRSDVEVLGDHPVIDAARDRLQQLPGTVEIASPQQSAAAAQAAQGGVRGEEVVHDLDARGRRGAVLGAPARRLLDTVLGPADHGHTDPPRTPSKISRPAVHHLRVPAPPCRLRIPAGPSG